MRRRFGLGRFLGGLGLAAAGALAAERGVMWSRVHEAPDQAGLVGELERAGLRWLRAGPTNPGSLSRSVIAWPGAHVERPDHAPELVGMRLHTNLWETYWQARTNTLTRFGPVAAFEIGNEPELHFTPDLPDRMAATLKAAWWGLKAASPDTLVLMPSLAAPPGPYAELLADNGMGRFTDAWNLHFYGWAHDFADVVAAHRRFLARRGWERLPLWVTEYGFAAFEAGLPDYEPRFLARQRTFFEQATLTGEAAGVDQLWAFCLDPYIGSGLDYGLFGPGYGERPAGRAFLEMARRLQHARLVYRLRLQGSGETVGLVLEELEASAADGHVSTPLNHREPARWWTLLFTPYRRADFALPQPPAGPFAQIPEPVPMLTHHDFQLRFPAGFGPVRLGLFGEHGEWTEPALGFTATAETNLHLFTPPRPFEVAGCAWEEIKPQPVRSGRTQPVKPAASPVVVTVLPHGPGVSADKSSLAYRHGVALPLRFTVTLHNFSETAHAGSWRLRLPDGWRPVAGRPTRGKVTLPPLGEARFDVAAWPPAAARSQQRTAVHAEWRGANRNSDTAVVWLAAAGAAVGQVTELPDAWEPLATETMEWIRQPVGQGTRFRLARLSEGTAPGLILPLPGDLALAPDDVLRIHLALPEAARIGRRRVELITAGREVFRHGEDLPLVPTGEVIECRVGDFTPAFWSRAGAGLPAAARYLRLGLFGLGEGDEIELGPVTRVR